MSTHRKIEWLLFIFGLFGFLLSVWFEANLIQSGLFGLGTLFAGLHAFKLYDGHKSNHVVVATSLTLVAYTLYTALLNYQNLFDNRAIGSGLLMSVILSVLSLRLRQDFHKN